MITVSNGTKEPPIKRKYEIVQFEISRHYLTYFINADNSGLGPDDFDALEEFESQFTYIHARCPDETDTYFTRCDIHGKLDDCIEVTFEVRYK